MLRSAAAFGYTGAFLCGSADLYHPKTLRGAMGALFTLDLHVFADTHALISHCQKQKLHLYGTSPHASKTLAQASFKTPYAVCFGNEGGGMSGDLVSACEECVLIPMHGMESLNAAAACAVVLYETQRSKL